MEALCLMDVGGKMGKLPFHHPTWIHKIHRYTNFGKRIHTTKMNLANEAYVAC